MADKMFTCCQHLYRGIIQIPPSPMPGWPWKLAFVADMVCLSLSTLFAMSCKIPKEQGPERLPGFGTISLPVKGMVLTRGCVHFGGRVDIDQPPRRWSTTGPGKSLGIPLASPHGQAANHCLHSSSSSSMLAL